MRNNLITKRFSIVEFFFWGTFAAYYPYLTIFLDSKGLNNIEIGAILGMNSFISVFAQPFWGMVSDKTQSIKKIFIILLSIAIIMISSLSIYEGALLLGIVFAIITFFESALTPLLDSWVIMGIQGEKNTSYGNIRLWGSIGYAVMVYVFGQLIEIKGVESLYICYALFGVITIFLCTKVHINPSTCNNKIKDLKISKLLKNYDYIIFLTFAVGIFIPHKAAYTFLPRLMDAVGGNKVHLGIALSVMALSEVPLFILSNRLISKVKPIYIILFSTIFFILRQFLFTIASSPIHVILIQGLQGLSFALFLTGAVYYIHFLAPQELKSTAQTFGSAIFMGGSGIVGNYGGGWVIEKFGLVNMYHMGTYLSFGITLFFVMGMYFRKLKEGNKNERK
ncbi:MFS transporter [Crassaminicella profunda]|uniref:MFS transporter n=1 Tax=Crassaminicella profunda TaxID=1286698 RepID=UPI001CA6ECE9|nr:MFS transporter [Crassaminicella profunda]QZY55066.1 MFS transporter [Crassaminicella profunda]